MYAVGEAGAMYTPASGQYYTQGTTPVTYAQVSNISENIKNIKIQEITINYIIYYRSRDRAQTPQRDSSYPKAMART